MRTSTLIAAAGFMLVFGWLVFSGQPLEAETQSAPESLKGLAERVEKLETRVDKHDDQFGRYLPPHTSLHDVLKDVQELQRQVRDLENQVRRMENDVRRLSR